MQNNERYDTIRASLLGIEWKLARIMATSATFVFDNKFISIAITEDEKKDASRTEQEMEKHI